MTDERLELEIRELIETETDAVRLSNKLFSQSVYLRSSDAQERIASALSVLRFFVRRNNAFDCCNMPKRSFFAAAMIRMHVNGNCCARPFSRNETS